MENGTHDGRASTPIEHPFRDEFPHNTLIGTCDGDTGFLLPSQHATPTLITRPFYISSLY